jgi:tetratricopeptide (TPR) repeat protein
MAAHDEEVTLDDARDAYEEGDIDEALAICESLIGGDETHADPEVLWLAAECLLELQDADEALHLLDAAIGQVPDEPLLKHVRAIALFELGRFDDARRGFEAAAASEPPFAEAIYYLGVLDERDGQDARAAERFAKAAEIDPESFVAPRTWSDAEVKSAFDAMVETTPEPFATWLAGLRTEIAAIPPAGALSRGESPLSPLALCLFQGDPAPPPAGEDPAGWLQVHPERVVFYARNLGKSAQDEYELQREVFEAVLWEAVEFLGLDDPHLDALGLLDADDEDEHPNHE